MSFSNFLSSTRWLFQIFFEKNSNSHFLFQSPVCNLLPLIKDNKLILNKSVRDFFEYFDNEDKKVNIKEKLKILIGSIEAKLTRMKKDFDFNKIHFTSSTVFYRKELWKQTKHFKKRLESLLL